MDFPEISAKRQIDKAKVYLSTDLEGPDGEQMYTSALL
jgi:hypothetical protein